MGVVYLAERHAATVAKAALKIFADPLESLLNRSGYPKTAATRAFLVF
jgi:hypothetical protein